MRIAAFLLAGSALAAGCDKSCQNTCFRIYDPNECNISVGGVPEDELKEECIAECNAALQRAGAMDGYDPYQPRSPTENVVLENERQAAEWMDCVWAADCSELDPASGICAPIP